MDKNEGNDDNKGRRALLTRVKATLEQARNVQKRLQRKYKFLVFGSLSASFFASLLAGVVAKTGPLGEWKWSVWCAIIAVLSALATLFSGLLQGFRISERLTKVAESVCRLHSLDIAGTMSHRKTQELAQEYQEVLTSHQELSL